MLLRMNGKWRLPKDAIALTTLHVLGLKYASMRQNMQAWDKWKGGEFEEHVCWSIVHMNGMKLNGKWILVSIDSSVCKQNIVLERIWFAKTRVIDEEDTESDKIVKLIHKEILEQKQFVAHMYVICFNGIVMHKWDVGLSLKAFMRSLSSLDMIYY